jgi:hypothetical protein
MSVPVVKQWVVDAGLESQSDSDFEGIHAEVSGASGHAHYDSVLFVGEISKFGPVPHVLVCKQAVSQTVEFSVSELLRGSPRNANVETSYVNCENQPLPSPPFTLHAKVIVYCYGAHADRWQRCVTPVPATEERLREARRWSSALSLIPKNAMDAESSGGAVEPYGVGTYSMIHHLFSNAFCTSKPNHHSSDHRVKGDEPHALDPTDCPRSTSRGSDPIQNISRIEVLATKLNKSVRRSHVGIGFARNHWFIYSHVQHTHVSLA